MPQLNLQINVLLDFKYYPDLLHVSLLIHLFALNYLFVYAHLCVPVLIYVYIN
jgi:hypothetical protein